MFDLHFEVKQNLSPKNQNKYNLIAGSKHSCSWDTS